MVLRSCRDVPANSTVFLRAGMDVPLDNGKITDPSRIVETLPTIDLLREKGCKIIIATKIGRPKGIDPALSTRAVADYLSHHYHTVFIPVSTGEAVAKARELAKPGQLIVLENLFFDPREEKNDPSFAHDLIAGCDCVVNDAYASAHREQASVTGVLQYVPGYMGLLMERELAMMKELNNPAHPYIAIIGGAKADKLSTIKGLLDKVDAVLVGGVLANTFLKATGHSVGQSKTDDTGLDLARELFASGKIVLPIDARLAPKFDKDAPATISKLADITSTSGMILDIGPETAQRYASILSRAKTIVWGGPIGVFEWREFAEGTKAIAKVVAESGAFTLAAGGDSGAALVALGYKEKITHVSTGGGVTLELLEGKALPAVVALEVNAEKFCHLSN